MFVQHRKRGHLMTTNQSPHELLEEEEEYEGGNIVKWNIDETSVVGWPANNKPFSLLKGKKLTKKELKDLQKQGVDISQFDSDDSKENLITSITKSVVQFLDQYFSQKNISIPEGEIVSETDQKSLFKMDEDIKKQIKSYVKECVDDYMEKKYPPKKEKEASGEIATPEPAEQNNDFKSVLALLTGLQKSIEVIETSNQKLVEQNTELKSEQTVLSNKLKSMSEVRPDGNQFGEQGDRPPEGDPSEEEGLDFAAIYNRQKAFYEAKGSV